MKLHPHRRGLRRTSVLITVPTLLVAGLGVLGDGAAVAEVAPAASAGAAGIGDSLYPTLGNGGYNVTSYYLNLKYETAKASQGYAGIVTIRAKATQALSSFHLDYAAGKKFGTVYVNDVKATVTRSGDDLVIKPKKAIASGKTFTVRVTKVVNSPTVADPDDYLSTLFFYTKDGSATAPQPDGFHYLFPSNDHPRDKATWKFKINTPSSVTAVANGQLVSKTTKSGRTTWIYEQKQRMATELVQLAVGKYKVYTYKTYKGVKRRDVVPTRLASPYASRLSANTNALLGYMIGKVGSYPFTTYGGLTVDADTGFSLETQTLSMFPKTELDQSLDYRNVLKLHEMSHSWFGNSVSPYRWADIWLNEGHATYYEWNWAAGHDALGTITGFSTLTSLMKDRYERGDAWRAAYGPVARPRSGSVYDLYTPQQYDGAALVLYALYKKIGSSKFSALEKKWVSTYKGKSPSTAAFISLANSVSGQDLTTFLKDWLYGTTTPPMPGHDDWQADVGSLANADGVTSLSVAPSGEARR